MTLLVQDIFKNTTEFPKNPKNIVIRVLAIPAPKAINEWVFFGTGADFHLKITDTEPS